MSRIHRLAMLGIIALFCVACSQTPSVTNMKSTPVPTTLHITEWYGITSFSETQIFMTTITDSQKITEAWQAIISLPNSLPNSSTNECGSSHGEMSPHDTFEFQIFQD